MLSFNHILFEPNINYNFVETIKTIITQVTPGDDYMLYAKQKHITPVDFWLGISKDFLRKNNYKIVLFAVNGLFHDNEEYNDVNNFFIEKKPYIYLLDNSPMSKSLIDIKKQSIDVSMVYNAVHFIDFLLFTEHFSIMSFCNNDLFHIWFGDEKELQKLFQGKAIERHEEYMNLYKKISNTPSNEVTITDNIYINIYDCYKEFFITC